MPHLSESVEKHKNKSLPTLIYLKPFVSYVDKYPNANDQTHSHKTRSYGKRYAGALTAGEGTRGDEKRERATERRERERSKERK